MSSLDSGGIIAAVQQRTLTPAAGLPPRPCPAANGIRGRCSGCWWSLKAGWFRLVDLGEGGSGVYQNNTLPLGSTMTVKASGQQGHLTPSPPRS